MFLKIRDTLQGSQLLPLLFKVLSEEESSEVMKRKASRLERNKYNYLCSQTVWLYMWKTTNIQQKKKPENEKQKPVRTNEQIQEYQDTKLTHERQLHFWSLTMNDLKKKWRKTVPLATASKRINYLGIKLIKEMKAILKTIKHCSKTLKET